MDEGGGRDVARRNWTDAYVWFSLRKVKMDQRKLTDNANTLVDMAKVGFIQPIINLQK